MKALIIECGKQFILHITGTQDYYLLTTDIFSMFISENPDFNNFNNSQKFPSTESHLINFFCNPEENSGAIIAERSVHSPQPKIFHRHRFNTLKLHFQSHPS